MYEGFYRLSKTPFSRDIPCDSLYAPPAFSEVIRRMEYVAKNRRFAVITGECGTGKTTALRCLAEKLDRRQYKMLYLSESKLTPSNFYRLLLEQLGIVPRWNRAEAKKQLQEKLSVMHALDAITTVCVIDESHLLSFEMLEEIRFMRNMKFDSISPIALILVGQTELWETRLGLQKCTAIRQRIDIQSTMNPYDRAMTGEFIQHQLRYAGMEHEIFTEAAVSRIYEYSKGLPRVISKVCTNVLIYGAQNRFRLIDDHAVMTVLECEFS